LAERGARRAAWSLPARRDDEQIGIDNERRRPLGQRESGTQWRRRAAAVLLRKCLCANLLRAHGVNGRMPPRTPRSHRAHFAAAAAASRRCARDVQHCSIARLCNRARHRPR